MDDTKRLIEEIKKKLSEISADERKDIAKPRVLIDNDHGMKLTEEMVFCRFIPWGTYLLMPPEAWDMLDKNLRGLDLSNKNNLYLFRAIVSGAEYLQSEYVINGHLQLPILNHRSTEEGVHMRVYKTESDMDEFYVMVDIEQYQENSANDINDFTKSFEKFKPILPTSGNLQFMYDTYVMNARTSND